MACCPLKRENQNKAFEKLARLCYNTANVPNGGGVAINRKRVWGNLLLSLTAMIWGLAFVAQSVGMNYVGPYTFNAARMLIGGIVLLPLIWVLDRTKGLRQPQAVSASQRKGQRKQILLGGFLCGLALFCGSSLQQVGILYTTAGKAGFITALYIIIVPLLGMFFKKPISILGWVGVAIATVGLYLLTIKEGFSMGKGDFLILLSSVFFACHILLVDHFSPVVNGAKMSCVQFFICGIVSLIPMFLWESPSWAGLLAAWLPLGYAGVLSCGVAYTLQMIAQKNTSATVASLLMSLESVFAALAGWLLLDEVLSPREFSGCVLVFCAIILAQLPDRRRVLS